MTMRSWVADLKAAPRKKALPVLSFPTISLMGITVKELIGDSNIQAKGMKMIADRVDSAASVSMMDLSLEAEAFGCDIRLFDDEVPTVTSPVISSEEDAKNIRIPSIGEGRTGRYIEAIGKAKKLITDRPVLAGVIGPFSLAGRLMDVNEALVNCYAEPDMVHETMKKVVPFCIEYMEAYKKIGANGAVMAEPLTGMLSPELAAEFSEPYVKQIMDAVREEDFIVLYHNCGDNTIKMVDSILKVGADGYHFGNAIKMKEMLSHIPSDILAMGNIDPSSQFNIGTPESIYQATIDLMIECCDEYPNFGISSGCDIPPSSPWENIDAFFKAVKDFYDAKNV